MKISNPRYDKFYTAYNERSFCALRIQDDPKFPRNKRKLMVAKKMKSKGMKSSGKNLL